MLEDLPLEILAAIVVQLTKKSDVKHLCEVSTRLCSLVTPLLYESIIVEAEDEMYLEDINTRPLLQTLCTPRNLLHLVKGIEITSQFHDEINQRCIHNKMGDAWMIEHENGDEPEDERSRFLRLVGSLMPLLEGCRNDYLRSFTWELGTCVPPEIMGPSGYLPLKQKGIESIRLVTDGGCEHLDYQEHPIALPMFEHLKRLSWRGLRSEDDFGTLRKALQRISNQLVELELDLIEWDLVRARLGWYSDEDDSDISEDDMNNFFASNILDLASGSLKQMFPTLRVLSLSAISFKKAAKEIAYAFNFDSLRSLKLRCCPGWEDFLQHASQSGQQIRLKSLEIQCTIESEDMVMEEFLAEFLRSFEGLEELFVSTSGPTSETVEVWRSALHHQSTLKRFVHHQRVIDIDQASRHFETEHDLPDLSFVPEKVVELVDASKNPLSELNLECIGFCCVPQNLKPILLPLISKRSLRVLHIRQSGSDLDRYASWGIRRNFDAPMPDDELDDGLLESDTLGSSQSNRRESSDKSMSNSQLPELTEPLRNFAQWAFGPDGFPSLQVIAVGDFSYKGRYAENSVLLCRNDERAQSGRQEVASQNYRLLADNDRSLRVLLDEYSDVLEACPTDSLMED